MSKTGQLAQDEQLKEPYEKIEDSDAFKMGYLKGMVRTTIYMLEKGSPDNAIRHLQDGCRYLKINSYEEYLKEVLS
jgi:hypothetical protein